MIDLANLEVWFVPGSQHLYGPEALKDVEEHSIAIAGALSASTLYSGEDHVQAGDDQQ